MRLLEKTSTRTIFDSLKESYNCETYEQAAMEACEEMFDTMTDDIFLNNVDVKEENNIVKVTFNVSAYGGEPDENGDIEMNRDAVIEVPLDYTDDGENMTVNKFYETICELLKQWIIDHHDGPESFYEGVMIDTGSTTVTSDEMGVTVEDNGNVITTGNGVTINVDNAGDALPAEMDVASPIDEPIDGAIEDIPAEDIENEEPVEELPEEPTEEIEEPVEDAEEDEDLDESTVNEEVLEKKDEETEEELNNSKVEECDKSDKKEKDKIEETADGYNQNQNVEIYQNPEFDYQILDITELDNTDTGDIRAIDMANILNDLDESLTEAIGTNSWGEINSFLTRKGTHKKTNENYSSAILELILPKLNESVGEYKNVFMLEVYGNGALKECIVRNSKSQIIKEYCGKTKNPVKHFEGVILDIMNSRIMNEDVKFMVDKPYEDKGINFADGKAIDKDVTRQEKHIKQHEKMLKNKKFKIEKEPDQDNTAGKTEEELTDIANIEKQPKPKKTKVKAEKIKVKEIKESTKLTEMGKFAKRMDSLRAASDRETIYNNNVEAQKIEKMKRLFRELRRVQRDVDELAEIKRKVHLSKYYNIDISSDEDGCYLYYDYDEKYSNACLYVYNNMIKMSTSGIAKSEVTMKEFINEDTLHDMDLFIKVATQLLSLYPEFVKYVNSAIDDYEEKFPESNQISESMKLKENWSYRQDEEKTYIDPADVDLDREYGVTFDYKCEECGHYYSEELDNVEGGDISSVYDDLNGEDDESDPMSYNLPSHCEFCGSADVRIVDVGKVYDMTEDDIDEDMDESTCIDKTNTSEEKLSKITESSETEVKDNEIDSIQDGEDLEESSSEIAIFHRRPASVAAMRAAEQNGITVNKSTYRIIGTKEMSSDEFENFANHLSSDEYDWLSEFDSTKDSSEFKCVEVKNIDDNSYSILVDPQGYKYARYAAIKDNTDEEELLEPEEGLIDDEPTEEVSENE